MKDLRENQDLKLVPFYTENQGKENSYTLCVDANTHDIYRVKDKEVNTSRYLLIFMLVLVLTRIFSIEILPLDNIFTFVVVSFLIFIISLTFGHSMRTKMFDNIQKIILTEPEWKKYLGKSRHFYLRQVIFATVLLILSISCFIMLYIFPTKWWFFGGIASSILTGTQISLLSKTRYLLYKNKLNITVNDGGEGIGDITHR